MNVVRVALHALFGVLLVGCGGGDDSLEPGPGAQGRPALDTPPCEPSNCELSEQRHGPLRHERSAPTGRPASAIESKGRTP